MTVITVTTEAIVARLFRRPNASLGTGCVDSVYVGLSDTSLHRLVVSNGTPTAARMRDFYGHHIRAKTQMKHITPGCYRKEALVPVLLQDTWT
jgi:hypothetical protein